VNGTIEGHVSSKENRATPPKTHESTCAPHERGEHDEARRAKAGVGGREAELRSQERWQIDREGDEPAKRQEVESAEQPRGRGTAKHRQHRGDGCGP
jgi:hypothetical protein